MLLIKNAEVYAPKYLGKKDVLICGGKIEKIQDEIGPLPIDCEVLDAKGKVSSSSMCTSQAEAE